MSKRKTLQRRAGKVIAETARLFRCPNCGAAGGRHFVPPCFGDAGFYICKPKAETDG